MEARHRGHSLRIQVVLYGTQKEQVWRQIWGLEAAIRHSRNLELLGEVNWVIGDSSLLPCLAESDVADIEATSRKAGLNSFSYDFFAENLGCSGGQNRLARGADEDFLLILNPDTYPSPTMLSELFKAMNQPSIGIAEARQIPIDHPKEYDLRTGDTSWASGCCMLVPRHVFELVDGFEATHFPTYCNDVDFSWRVRLRQYRVVTAPRATVFHDKRITLEGNPELAPLEMEHTTLGRFLLATRFGRPDVVEETIQFVDTQGREEQRLALAEFRRRESEGTLPTPIPEAARVAQFIGGEYARHRF